MAAGFRGVAGFGDPRCGFGFWPNPAIKTAGQMPFLVSLRGLAGFNSHPYMYMRAHARMRVREWGRPDSNPNPANPAEPRNQGLTCGDFCGVWSTPNPFGKPRSLQTPQRPSNGGSK